MDFAAFKSSIERKAPPDGMSKAVEALWWDAKDDWKQAHECAQAQDDKEGAWVHAYLHRKEGDRSNAGYWYRRAGKKMAEASLQDEWEAIARSLLASG